MRSPTNSADGNEIEIFGITHLRLHPFAPIKGIGYGVCGGVGRDMNGWNRGDDGIRDDCTKRQKIGQDYAHKSVERDFIGLDYAGREDVDSQVTSTLLMSR